MLDKQIHRNEMKLRLLLTDGCNKNCNYCLNDFQKKPLGEKSFLPLATAFSAIEYYNTTLGDKVHIQIYLSGGEPTLHPYFIEILAYAYHRGKVNLNTNGTTLSNTHIRQAINDMVDDVHISPHEISETIRDYAKDLNATIQMVYCKKDPIEEVYRFIDFYLSAGLKVKVFQNFLEYDNGYYVDFSNEIRQRSWYDTKYTNVSFRFTGIQENRGILCRGCFSKCITLKALWVYPDGGIAMCPQLLADKKKIPTQKQQWEIAFNDAYLMHKPL